MANKYCIIFLSALVFVAGTPDDSSSSDDSSHSSSASTKYNCTRPNEKYDCGSACQTTCATIGQECAIKTYACVPDCFCKKGYIRSCNRDDECIPQYNCRFIKCGSTITL